MKEARDPQFAANHVHEKWLLLDVLTPTGDHLQSDARCNCCTALTIGVLMVGHTSQYPTRGGESSCIGRRGLQIRRGQRGQCQTAQ